MIHYIMRQWNSKKGSIFLIILGFFIGSLVLSIGTSITVENYKYIYDQTSGNPEEQVDIIMKGEKGLPKSEFTKLLLTFVKYGEVQLLNMSKVRLDDYSQEYYFVPILFQEQPKWHIPLIKGRYFEKEDTVTKEKKVIVGKKIAERNGIKEKDSIKINKEQYTVIGICGRDIRETQWDEVIYVYYDEFFENNEFYLASEGELTSILKEGKQQFMENKDIILAKAENSGI